MGEAEDEAQSIDVSEILQNKFKPATADKEDDLKYDLFNLCASDTHPIDIVKFRQNTEEYLESLSRDNTQLLITKIFQLPTRSASQGVIAALPKQVSNLPRTKHIPKPKAETRWDKYAKIKGIKKKKTDRMVWDEEHQQFRPRWRANSADDTWVIEHKEGTDPSVDPFLQQKLDKKARVEKNTAGKKHNTKTQNEEALPGGVSAPRLDIGARKSKLVAELGNTLNLASFSTASVGKFDKRLPGEKGPPVREGKRKLAGISDKHDAAGEKVKNMVLIDKMFAKEEAIKPVDTEKVTNKFMAKDEVKNMETKRKKILEKVHKKQKKRK